MKTFIETERLVLREIVPGDVDGLFALDSDPEVHRYLGNKPLQNKEQAMAVIDFIRQQYHDNGIGRWAVIHKPDNGFAGWAGLKWITEPLNNQVHFYDMGYRLLRKYWGRGIATECARVSLDYGFDVLKTQDIYAAAHVGNAASNHVLKKTGLHFIETFQYDGSEHNWYHISRSEWRGKTTA